MSTRNVTYPLRLPKSLQSAVRKLSEQDGTTMNQFVVVAAAEKVSAMTTAAFFEERRSRADPEAFQKIEPGRRGAAHCRR